MNPLTLIGAVIITFSLLSYGLGSITLQRFKLVGRSVIVFLTLGCILDFVAIICMLKGAPGSWFDVHAILHYFAFLVMFVFMVWVWKVYIKEGLNTRINEGLHWFTKFAYGVWVIAYMAGSIMVIF